MSNADYEAPSDPLFKSNKILKLSDQYICGLSGLMWDFDHDQLPTSLNKSKQTPSTSTPAADLRLS